jgi:hypothetical protein
MIGPAFLLLRVLRRQGNLSNKRRPYREDLTGKTLQGRPYREDLTGWDGLPSVRQLAIRDGRKQWMQRNPSRQAIPTDFPET